jgi:polygalacturonase
MPLRRKLVLFSVATLGAVAAGCGSNEPRWQSGTGGSGATGAAATTGSAGTGASGAGGAGAGTAGGATGNGGSAAGATGMAGTGGTGTSGGAGGHAGTSGGAGTGAVDPIGTCAVGDSMLPPEPTIPPACTTLAASFAIVPGTPPDETNLDTARLQAAISGCPAGQSVKLVADGTNNGFITGPITIATGVTLWVDAGVTLYGTRDPNVYGSASALISVHGANTGIVGAGAIDGQGGEPNIGSTMSFWDANGANGSSPALIQVTGATNFTLYEISLHNAPMFHVKLGAAGFVVWGVTIKTPSTATNSVGTKLTPSSAHNTDGIDPGQAASNGFILYSSIWVGDDDVAIKGGTSVKDLVIAHNHFGAGHGMSIGSETNGGVSNVTVYDLSVDGTGTGLGGGSSNGIRIKSDISRGGPVTHIAYCDVCTRELTNPIIITPKYTASATGNLIPLYTDITIRNFHALATTSTPRVTVLGYDATHITTITLDNVVVDNLGASNITSSYANVALGPGAVSFTPSGTGVTVTDNTAGTSTPNDCANKWVSF